MAAAQVSFFILDTVDSTNNYAMAKVHAGMAKHGNAYYAALQTAGKGQRGKVWESAVNQNITLSIVLQTQAINASQQFYLSVAVALGAYDFFSKYARAQTTIKWPNDIYWCDRKAGGILIENIFHGNKWRYAVAGIGININQSSFSPQLKNPVSLSQVTGDVYDAVQLARELHVHVLERFTALEQKQYKGFLEEYNCLLYGAGKNIKLKKGAVVFDTKIVKVNEAGQLVTMDTTEHRFDFGEIEWVL